MQEKNKEQMITDDSSALNKLKLGANESGSCDYPNIQRFGFTSKKKDAPEDKDEAT